MADTKEKKIRLYKLATEYNLSAESLVEFLKTKGFKVKNHMTQLEDDMITAINAHYKKEIEKAEHHYKKLAEFHKKRAERASKDVKDEGKEVEVQEISEPEETVEPISTASELDHPDVSPLLSVAIALTWNIPALLQL